MKAIVVRGKLLYHVNLVGSNGETIMSSETYYSKSNARRSAKSVNDDLAGEKNQIIHMVPKGKQYSHVNTKGVTYYLNMKYVSLRGGELVPIYYFSKDAGRKEASPLPSSLGVNENPRNGFLTVKQLSLNGSSR